MIIMFRICSLNKYYKYFTTLNTKITNFYFSIYFKQTEQIILKIYIIYQKMRRFFTGDFWIFIPDIKRLISLIFTTIYLSTL